MSGYTRFCVYAADGTILRTGTVPVDSVDIQAVHAGEAAMACDQAVRSGTFKMDLSGKVPIAVAMTQQEIDTKVAAQVTAAKVALQAEQVAEAAVAAQLVLPLQPAKVGP